MYSDWLRSLESQHKDARNPNKALRNSFVAYAVYSMSCNCLSAQNFFFSFQKHLNNPVDVHAKKMFTMLPKTPLMTRKKKRKKLTHLEELEEHTFTVQ